MRAENAVIVYLDEINFTKRSISLREWSQKNSNLAIDQKDIMIGYRSVLASITSHEGIALRQYYAQAITGKDFADFLVKLRLRYPKRKLAVFMDQLRVHKELEHVQPMYIRHKITPIFNVAYSPEFNPIEAVFSKVKAIFNRRRLNCLVRKIGFNIDETIKLAFRSISKDHCTACVRKSMHLLEKACNNV